jgi:hypothetical protein
MDLAIFYTKKKARLIHHASNDNEHNAAYVAIKGLSPGIDSRRRAVVADGGAKGTLLFPGPAPRRRVQPVHV